MSAATDLGTARHDDAQRDAVAESMTLLATRWPAWCAEHGIPAGPPPVPDPPVLYRVGADLAHVQWVAVLRFDVVVHGERLRGLVRGPADDAVFKVRRRRERRAHRHWWGRH